MQYKSCRPTDFQIIEMIDPNIVRKKQGGSKVTSEV